MEKQTKKQKEIVAFYKASVERGVKLLNKEIGKETWLNKIDLGSLDLSGSNTCICGQIFGNYWEAQFEAFQKGTKFSIASMGSGSPRRKFAVLHGFSIDPEHDDDSDLTYWDLLTHLWYVKIVDLKIKAGLIP